MENINILKLSLYQIQMFLSVARSESITISARNLHLSQSMLSKNIARIEEELGLILFWREKGRLKLTSAGRIMQNELSVAMDIIELGIEKAYAEQAVQTRPLRIGYPDSNDQSKCLLPSVTNFRNITGDFRYNIEFYKFRDLPVEIQRGTLDLIFSTLFEERSIKASGMEYEIITRYPLTIHVTRESPLAGKDSVSIDELRTMRLVMPSPRVVPNYYENVILKLFQGGPAPKVSYYANSSDAVAANIVNADEIFISDCFRKVEEFYNLVRIPIRETESGMILAWKKGAHPLVDSFAENTIAYWKTHNAE